MAVVFNSHTIVDTFLVCGADVSIELSEKAGYFKVLYPLWEACRYLLELKGGSVN